jgi:hypothetical protein
MDSKSTRELLRLHRIEQSARRHFQLAWKNGQTLRLSRAARLESAASSRSLEIVCANVGPYGE